MGDGIQAAKAGILEIGDIFVVNKSDRDGAQALIRELADMIALGERPAGAWKPPIVSTVATRAAGIGELLDRIDQFRAGPAGERGLAAYAGWPGPGGGREPGPGPAAAPSSRSRTSGRAGCDWPGRSAGASWTRTPPPTSLSAAR